MVVSVKQRSYIVKLAIERLQDAGKRNGRERTSELSKLKRELEVEWSLPTNCRTISKTVRQRRIKIKKVHIAVNLFFCGS